MPSYLDMELTKTAYKLLHDLLKIKVGESVLITSDSITDFRVAEEIAKMAEALGAKVMVAWHSTPEGYGAVTMPYLPDPLKACVDQTDVWIELNSQWLLYSPIWEKAVSNGRTRQLMLGGLSVERIVRCIGKVDIAIQKDFQDELTAMTKRSKKMRITNEAGTDVSFDLKPTRPVNSELMCDKPGGYFLLGQIAFSPEEESINGKIVFDGAISGGGDAELGVLDTPIFYIVEKGRIVEIGGGAEVKIIRNYFEKLDDPNMYIAAHVCYGVNPYAKLEGVTTEDERVWGCTQWGFGHQGSTLTGEPARVAKSHIDGICLNSTVYLDGEKILDNGVYIHPKLKELAAKLGK